MPTSREYDHTQRGLLHGLLAVLAIGFLAVTPWAHADEPLAAYVLAGGAVLLAALAPCFAHLRIRDDGDALEIAFGPVRLFRRRVAYDDIVSVRVGRSALIDGWGIHWIPGRGWTWNLHGFAAVEIELRRGRRLRVGTDDAPRLAAFLESRAAATQDA